MRDWSAPQATPRLPKRASPAQLRRATCQRPAARRQRHQKPPAPTTAPAASPRANSRCWSLSEPLEDRRHVDLIRFVIAGQHVHDEVDAKAHRHLALLFAPRHDRVEWLSVAIDGPCAGPIISADDDARDPVIDVVVGRLDPHGANIPTAW